MVLLQATVVYMYLYTWEKERNNHDNVIILKDWNLIPFTINSNNSDVKTDFYPFTFKFN